MTELLNPTRDCIPFCVAHFCSSRNRTSAMEIAHRVIKPTWYISSQNPVWRHKSYCRSYTRIYLPISHGKASNPNGFWQHSRQFLTKRLFPVGGGTPLFLHRDLGLYSSSSERSCTSFKKKNGLQTLKQSLLVHISLTRVTFRHWIATPKRDYTDKLLYHQALN